jgi:hypothetical protein
MPNEPRDLAARLLAVAVRRMPEERSDWGAAMLAELTQVEGFIGRWQFVAGGILVALFPPRGPRLTQIVVPAPVKGRTIVARPGTSAALGALCLVPFLAANAIVANRIEPFFSLIRPGAHTAPREYALLATVLSLILVGGVVALRPLWGAAAAGRRRVRPLNVAVGLLLLGMFAWLSLMLGTEIYRCDVLGMRNCD